MKRLKYEFIGWYKDDKSDRIWGAIELLEIKSKTKTPTFNKYLLFWGRRGSKYRTKFLSSLSQSYVGYSVLSTKIEDKIRKGYKEVDRYKLEDIYPEFEKDILDITFWTMMTKTDKLTVEEWEKIKQNIF